MKKWLFRLVCLFALLWIGRSSVFAQNGYPTPINIYVSDYADVITNSDEAYLQSLFEDAYNNDGLEATVLTIRSIRDYDTGDSDIDSFATNLFNTWGIGNQEVNNGVLILVAVDDRGLVIRLGDKYESQYNDDAQRVIDQQIVPRFREERFSQGIVDGADAILGIITQVDSHTNVVVPTRGVITVPSDSPLGTTESGESFMSRTTLGILGVLGGIGAAILGVLAVFWQRILELFKHKCPHCDIEMVLLDEQADDAYLDKGQTMEEFLRSVNYNVRRCPQCEYHTIDASHRWLSGYHQCKSCGYRAMKESQRTIKSATCHSSGTAQVNQSCRHCQYKNQYTITLPKRNCDQNNHRGSSFGSSSSSSSSSSRSFGGGSSSGGGASGSW